MIARPRILLTLTARCRSAIGNTGEPNRRRGSSGGFRMRVTLVLVASAMMAAAMPAAAQDAAAGKALFKSTCAVCHSEVAGKNGVGPSLAGIVGSTAGVV